MRPLLAALVVGYTTIVKADLDHPARHDDAYALAMIAVSEAGFDITTDIDGIYQVLRAGSIRRHTTFFRYAHAYSTRVFTRARDDERRYIAWLRLDGVQPKYWPENMNWQNYRARWLMLVERARVLVAGQETPLCLPMHWGSCYGIDRERAMRARWSRVQCGDSRNCFYDGIRRR